MILLRYLLDCHMGIQGLFSLKSDVLLEKHRVIHAARAG